MAYIGSPGAVVDVRGAEYYPAYAHGQVQLTHLITGEIFKYEQRDGSLELPTVEQFQLMQHCGDAVSAEADARDCPVVITCTVTDRPYLAFHWLSRGTFLANVSIMDVERNVFLKVDKVVVDDWDQSNREKKIINLLVEAGEFSREQLHAELGEIIVGDKPGRETDDEIILLNPMGMAIDDIACAKAILGRAEDRNIGTVLPLF